MIYVKVGNHWHKQTGEVDGTTECGLTVPFRAPWARPLPAGAKCPRCFRKLAA